MSFVSLCKKQKADPDYGVGINPISRLIQIQQAKKEKEPVYTLIAEKGQPRRKEFVMQVSNSAWLKYLKDVKFVFNIVKSVLLANNAYMCVCVCV